MALITKPYTFSNGATIVAAEHNSNFDTVYNAVNGNLNTANLAAGAAIALSQISFTTALAMSGAITKWAKGADVASVAGAITLGDDGNVFDITGTNAITSITAKTAGTIVVLQFDSTASVVDGSNLKINGNFTGAAESTLSLYCDGTNWFEIARSPLSYTPTVSNALAGSVIQVVNTQTGAVSTGTTAIPYDDSIPQNTEGDQYMTLAITPNHASNKLKIDVVAFLANPGASNMTCALFQDSTAGALAAACDDNGNGLTRPFNFTYYMAAGTTSATTFKVRAGASTGATTTFNGLTGGRLMGGVLASSITISEIKV